MSEREPEQLSLGDFSAAEPAAVEPARATAAAPPTGEQARAIGSRDIDVLLEAGAGTGKTRVLVDRYCDAVDADGVEPEQILAFTFTEKAAAEMRRRVRVELGRRAAQAVDPERRERLEAAARSGESAPVTTIHGFCRSLLAAHPVAAGLDPRFRVLDAEEAARLASFAFDDALRELASGDDAVALTAAGYRDRIGAVVRNAHRDLRNRGITTPVLPPIQIDALEGSDEPPSPAEIEALTSGYDALERLLAAYSGRYEELKAERSGVDFDDLQLIALELLRTNRSIAASQRERFLHLLVDEFQDTSPIQVELVAALSGSGTRVFAVGDEFQSIYAFRGADLASFRDAREELLERQRAGTALVLPLTGSFRSTPDVVAAVNAVGEALLDDFRPLRVGRLPEPAEAGEREPAVELLLTRRDGWGNEEAGTEIKTAAGDTAQNRIAEARALAGRLRELADEGVPPGEMVLLLRAFSNVDAYAEALELAGLDPYVVGGRGYWSAQQVTDALGLLTCIANPLDDEALIGALSSPAGAISPDALWILRRISGRGRHLWPAVEDLIDPRPASEAPGEGEAEPPSEEELARQAETERWKEALPGADRDRLENFYGRMTSLRREAALLPLDSLVETALSRFGYDLAALRMDDGRRRAANLLKLVQMAAEYEAHEGRDLRGFLEGAASRAAFSNRESEAATAGADHDGVRVMTVHAAKGLEFTCVAVGDLGRGLSAGGRQPELRLDFAGEEESAEGSPPSARVGLRLARAGATALSVAGYRELNDAAADAEAEESGRLAYVAASRARERLILSGLFGESDLEEPDDKPRRRRTAIGCLLPALGCSGEPEEILEIAPAEARAELDVRFAPARIRTRVIAASAESAAELEADLRSTVAGPGPEGDAEPPMLALAERGAAAARSLSYAALADYRRCGYRFLTERVLGLGNGSVAASAPVGTAGDAPEQGEGIDWDEEPEAGEGEAENEAEKHVPRRDRMGYGRAIHDLLEWSAAHDWERPGRERVEATLLREGASAEQRERAAAMISGWLESPQLAELRERGARFRAELPFRMALGEGTILRGSIDLLAEIVGEPPLVLDYKTDRLAGAPPEELPEAYRLQRALYASVVAAACESESVRSAYVFLDDPSRPLLAELDATAISAGRAELEALIGEIRESRFPPTLEPHAGLCHDCPARERLCPYPRAVTLAPAS